MDKLPGAFGQNTRRGRADWTNPKQRPWPDGQGVSRAASTFLAFDRLIVTVTTYVFNAVENSRHRRSARLETNV